MLTRCYRINLKSPSFFWMKRGKRESRKKGGRSLPQRSQKLSNTARPGALPPGPLPLLGQSHGNVLENIQEIKELLKPLQQASNVEGDLELSARSDSAFQGSARTEGTRASPTSQKHKRRRVLPWWSPTLFPCVRTSLPAALL